MEKIKFENGKAPYINDVNLNKLQDNIEIAIDEKSANIPVSDTEPTAEDVELWIDTSEYMAVFKYKDPNTQKWEIVNSTVTGDTLPIGAIIPYSSDNIPDNWLLADGRAVSRIEYKKLFDVIGVTYGSGDGSTTFNLPNLKGKIPVGQDEDSLEFAPLAMEGGEKTHTLTINEIPPHTHKTWIKDDSLSETKDGYDNYFYGKGHFYNNTSQAGGGRAHNNLQPYLVTNYIIKAAQSSGVVATVVDSLESESETDALSANQGRILNDRFNYSTTEKVVGIWIDGKPLYRKVISCGALPNSTSKLVNHNISDIDNSRMYGFAVRTSDKREFPLPFSSVDGNGNIQLDLTSTQIQITTNNDRSSFNTSYVILEYTKTTD